MIYKFSATFNEDEYIGLDELSLEALQRNKRVALIIGNDEYLSNPLQFEKTVIYLKTLGLKSFT